MRTTPPFRADHVGSLLRPPEVADARERFERGDISAAERRAVEDAAIRDIVAMQQDVGLRSITDGELRRRSWHMDFIYALQGIGRAPAGQAVDFTRPDGKTVVSAQGALRVEGKVALGETIFGEDFAYVQSLVTDGTPKLTIPSPNMIYARGGRAAIDADVYPDLDEFWADVIAAYGEELTRLGGQGCRYLQFDDTSLATMNDPRQQEMLRARGDDPEQLLADAVRHLNAVIARRSDGMAITTHMCRGNYRSSFAAEGSYDFVAEHVFSELDVDGFFAEFDDERSGGFEPLRFVPKGKLVVLGLVTTKVGELESKDELKRRVEEASRHVPVEQLCLSPQCGFASTLEGNDLTPEQQLAKLRLVVETAEEIWGA
jgi:5-methyltetrahydropteroyltriglutamate--homocysteine methyltransferase